ncbi:MAG TPA: phosphodiester glycosidase family protein [Acidimicrobiales bacterium]|nr:phosphodiester glycosidase family protein [Acidimicrobiales bacterium]
MATDARTVALHGRSPSGSLLSRIRPWVRRHRLISALLALLLVLGPWEASFASALAGPGPGSLSARAAEWARDHGGASAVSWVENLWYSRHPPPRGGHPPRGAIPAASSPAAPPVPAVVPPHLTPPAPIVPLASPALPGEGVWHPAGRPVDGVTALYEAFLRPDAVHTSLVAGVAWMDTTLLRVQLYSGSYIPGAGPWAHSAPVPSSAATSLVAAFNSGFRLKDSMGGYYSEGRTVAPLRVGAASLVIYRDGTATVGSWGRDAVMGPDVASVRQNLRLLVDGGAAVPGLATGRTWGATVRNRTYVWRSGMGVTASGALVYVAGPGLDVPSLASLLVRSGAVRAMELDINADWVNFTAYAPPAGGRGTGVPAGPGLAAPGNGATLLAGMSGGTGRYFAPWWNRDFVAVFAAYPAALRP